MTNIEFIEEHIEQLKEVLFDDELQPLLAESVELELKYWESILKELKELEEYKTRCNNYMETVHKMLEPIVKEKDGEQLVQSILNGKATVIKAQLTEMPYGYLMATNKRIAILYEVKDDKNN